MQFTIIAASHQSKSVSEKVGKYIESILKKDSLDTNFFNLRDINLPHWAPEVYEDEAAMTKWGSVRNTLQASDGFVFITPEYNGMATPHIKNFFLYASAKELAHKAALIVSVSSGIGGSYPINELRTSGYKNTRLCYTPDHVIVRYGTKVLETEKPSDESDTITRRRIQHGLEVLIAYSKALTTMRNNTALLQEDLPNGM